MSAGPELRPQDELPTTASLTYPFAKHGYTEKERELAKEVLEALQARFGLFPDPARTSVVVDAFISACGTPGSPADAIRLSCELLALTIFFGDRVTEPDCAALIDESLIAFHRPSDSKGSAPSTVVSAYVRRQLNKYIEREPGNGVAFLSALERTWCAFRRESQQLSGLPMDMDDYLELRQHTIAAGPYLQGWKLLHDFPASLRMSHGESLRRIEQYSTRVQYLANDLASVKRDINRSQRNAVLIEAQLKQIPLTNAWVRVREQHDEAAVRLSDAIGSVRHASTAAQLHAYLDEVEACTWGNLDCLQLLEELYAKA